jgi:hypothetical protein
VPVQVKRDADGGVAHEDAERLRVDPGGNHQARRRVAAVVDRQRLQPGIALRLRASLHHLACVVGTAKEPRIGVIHAQLDQVVAQHGRDRHPAAAVAALGRNLTLDGVPAAPDVDHPGGQVYVLVT